MLNNHIRNSTLGSLIWRRKIQYDSIYSSLGIAYEFIIRQKPALHEHNAHRNIIGDFPTRPTIIIEDPTKNL